MGRKRIEIGPEADARIVAGVARGETAEQLAVVIGQGVSSRTIGRRMRELRGPVAPSRSWALPPAPKAPKASEEPTSDDSEGEIDAIPEGATLPELSKLLERCKLALTEAEQAKNLPLVGQMIRVAASLAETIRKATPPERADPNDAPDMVALGRETPDRLLKAIALVTETM